MDTLGNIICKRNKVTKISRLKVDNRIINDPVQIANGLNDLFYKHWY